MGDVKRIIIDATAGRLVNQVTVAHTAMNANIVEGEIMGVRSSDGLFYGVKRNKFSIRVYPQEAN